MTASVPDQLRQPSLRILTFTTLYPNAVAPQHGIFVEQRLRNLLSHQNISSRVIAPVPWFPFKRFFGTYSELAAVPCAETRHGVDVLHPRYPVIPKIGMTLAPLLLAAAAYRSVRQHALDSTGFDLIDAHYFYPDGISAIILGNWLLKPVTITARGTDVNLIPGSRVPRKWILWAAERCSRIITVSDALRDRLIEIGVARGKIRTLRNGVDLEFFRPLPDRNALRIKLGIEGPTLLSIGHLIERKGHHLVIQALHELPSVKLIIVGTGSLRNELERLARRLNLTERVRFTGAIQHEKLKEYYCAADALVLASSREGMANVLLESIACGTPVVATPYWGNPEVVGDSRAGVLTKDRTPCAIADAIRSLLNNRPTRAAVRKYAEGFGWGETSRGQMMVFHEALNTKQAP